jgi:hypothetical protein
MRIGACQTPKNLGDVDAALRVVHDFADQADAAAVDPLLFRSASCRDTWSPRSTSARTPGPPLTAEPPHCKLPNSGTSEQALQDSPREAETLFQVSMS